MDLEEQWLDGLNTTIAAWERPLTMKGSVDGALLKAYFGTDAFDFRAGESSDCPVFLFRWTTRSSNEGRQACSDPTFSKAPWESSFAILGLLGLSPLPKLLPGLEPMLLAFLHAHTSKISESILRTILILNTQSRPLTDAIMRVFFRCV